MNKKIFTIIIVICSCVNLFAQSDDMIYRYFFKAGSTYVMVDDSKDNWFTLEFRADTLFQTEDNRIIYDNKKWLQTNVLPFSKIKPNQKKTITISKALQAYKKWELDYQKKMLKTKLKSGEEFYYRRDDKPFLIWWHKVPPIDKSDYDDEEEYEYDPETGTIVEVKSFNVTHMLFLNFSIYAARIVSLTIPVFEDENLQEEIEKLKDVANSLRVYGGGSIDMDILIDIKKSKEKYVLRDSLNLLELEIPDWLNIVRPLRRNIFTATFPEKYEVVNAMSMRWDYKNDSLSFNDFINRANPPHKNRTDYRLIEKNDSTFRYFHTSDNGWFYHQVVYLKGDSIYCLVYFTATRNTYDYNIKKFEEIIRMIKLK